jgi:methionyl-tRNA formyltransferase
MTKRFAVIGNSTFSEQMSNGFIEAGNKCVYAFSNSAGHRPNATNGISAWARGNGIPYMDLDDINSVDSAELLKKLELDFLAVSWPKVLKNHILSIPKLGCIGTHPTNLPFGRGRHPLHWILSMGLTSTTLSFFLLDNGLDSGDLLLQLPIQIDPKDDIKVLSEKINNAAYAGAVLIGSDLNSLGTFTATKQSVQEGSYWRKRNATDIEIDCRMSCASIIRLVGSITLPYECAILVNQQGNLRIKDAFELDNPVNTWQFHVLGTILDINESHLDLRVDQGVIRLILEKSQKHALKKLDVVHPPSHYYKKLL